jgi:hypothetical protein
VADLLTLGLIGGGIWAASKLFGKGKGKGAGSPGVVSSGFEPFPPDVQPAAWFQAVSVQWAPAGQLGDGGGRVALTYRGKAQGDAAQNRLKNDASFRKPMADGFRLVVSEYLANPAANGIGTPYLLLVPDGFSRASVPSDWGPLRQLYAPPPGSFGAPLPGPAGGGAMPGPFGGETPGQVPGVKADPFAEIGDPATRQKAKELYINDDASLLELDVVAKELDLAGYHASAAALRARRQELALRHSIDAKVRGGWLYVVRQNDLPWKVAQHYGGIKPGVIGELAKANPTVSANNWTGWHPGVEILLPGTWPDPSLKPLPPLAVGKPSAPQQQTAPKPTTPLPSTPSGPIAAAPGTYPGQYIDPATGKPVKAPGSLPWTDPGNPWGAAGPPGSPLPGGGMIASMPPLGDVASAALQAFGGE